MFVTSLVTNATLFEGKKEIKIIVAHFMKSDHKVDAIIEASKCLSHEAAAHNLAAETSGTSLTKDNVLKVTLNKSVPETLDPKGSLVTF